MRVPGRTWEAQGSRRRAGGALVVDMVQALRGGLPAIGTVCQIGKTCLSAAPGEHITSSTPMVPPWGVPPPLPVPPAASGLSL
jgi:hypothetical protein